MENLRKIMVVRQSFYLPPGAAAEDIYRDRDLWTYATLVIAVQKMGYTLTVPTLAEEWLQDDLCQQHMAFAMSNPATGVFHEIISHVFKDTESISSTICMDDKSVQTEQNSGEMFVQWVTDQLNASNIIMSQRGSIVHAVEDGIIITSNAFRAFNKDYSEHVRQDFLKLDIFQDSNLEKKWNAGQGIFIVGYLVKYELFSNLMCDISINDALELCE
ncbi:MAG: hypothetical protein Q9M10_02185 [Mariprofundaceae bacterium]|nr:hypothetical protein [Mariprofundaceae bacterium]